MSNEPFKPGQYICVKGLTIEEKTEELNRYAALLRANGFGHEIVEIGEAIDEELNEVYYSILEVFEGNEVSQDKVVSSEIYDFDRNNVLETIRWDCIEGGQSFEGVLSDLAKQYDNGYGQEWDPIDVLAHYCIDKPDLIELCDSLTEVSNRSLADKLNTSVDYLTLIYPEPEPQEKMAESGEEEESSGEVIPLSSHPDFRPRLRLLRTNDDPSDDIA